VQAFVKTVMKLQVLYNTGNFLAGWGTVSFSGRTLLQGISKLFSLSVSQSVSQLVKDNNFISHSFTKFVSQLGNQPASQPAS
jgi:hypothetical protein